MQQNEEHLRLLSIFHYVVGGLMGLFACFPIMHLAMGVFLLAVSTRGDAQGDAPPAFMGWMLIGMATVAIIAGWSVAVCILIAGRFLAGRKHYMFCMAVAGIECIFMPFGTVLGVFTIIVLVREDVKRLFATRSSMGMS
jgi:hypothetical protein